MFQVAGVVSPTGTLSWVTGCSTAAVKIDINTLPAVNNASVIVYNFVLHHKSDGAHVLSYPLVMLLGMELPEQAPSK